MNYKEIIENLDKTIKDKKIQPNKPFFVKKEDNMSGDYENINSLQLKVKSNKNFNEQRSLLPNYSENEWHEIYFNQKVNEPKLIFDFYFIYLDKMLRNRTEEIKDVHSLKNIIKNDKSFNYSDINRLDKSFEILKNSSIFVNFLNSELIKKSKTIVNDTNLNVDKLLEIFSIIKDVDQYKTIFGKIIINFNNYLKETKNGELDIKLYHLDKIKEKKLIFDFFDNNKLILNIKDMAFECTRYNKNYILKTPFYDFEKKKEMEIVYYLNNNEKTEFLEFKDFNIEDFKNNKIYPKDYNIFKIIIDNIEINLLFDELRIFSSAIYLEDITDLTDEYEFYYQKKKEVQLDTLLGSFVIDKDKDYVRVALLIIEFFPSLLHKNRYNKFKDDKKFNEEIKKKIKFKKDDK